MHIEILSLKLFKTFNNLVHPQSYSVIEYFKTVLASMLVIASIVAIIAVIVGIIYLPILAYKKLIGKISTDLKLLDKLKGDYWNRNSHSQTFEGLLDEKELKKYCPNSYKLLKKIKSKDDKYEFTKVVNTLKRIRNIRIGMFIALIVIIYVPIILPLILMIMGLIGKTFCEIIGLICLGFGIVVFTLLIIYLSDKYI